jgi:hypothetical protein
VVAALAAAAGTRDPVMTAAMTTQSFFMCLMMQNSDLAGVLIVIAGQLFHAAPFGI